MQAVLLARGHDAQPPQSAGQGHAHGGDHGRFGENQGPHVLTQ